MIHKVCIRPECDNPFSSKDNRKKYCSRSCAVTVNNRSYPKRVRVRTVRKSRLERWLLNEWDATIKSGLSRSIRNYLLEQADFKCQDGRSGCNNWSGINPKSGKTCLTIDHIDGNFQNNVKDNLRVMCPNCHSMTETYGALNKGNGRSTRYVAVT